MEIAQLAFPATMRRDTPNSGGFVIQFAFIRSLAALIIVVLFAAACEGNGKKQDSADETQSLIIYTGRDKDEVERVIDLFTQKNPKYKGKVETLILGAQTALDRLKAERANPQAGFLWGGTQQGLQQAANEGLLAPSNPAHANLIDPARKDKQGRWYAEMLYPEVIIYNHDLLKPEQAPKDWDDLITPPFRGKIVIRDVVGSGTMRTIYSVMMYRQGAATGSPEAGYAWLRKLEANTVSYTPTPEDMYFNLDRGVGTVTMWNLQDALIQPNRNKRPWSYVLPASGVPVLLDGVGVVNNPRSMQAALDFENFLLEPELQNQLSKDYYQIPAMQLPDSEKPEWLVKLDYKEMKIDWDALGAKQTEWMNYWAQNIKGKRGK